MYHFKQHLRLATLLFLPALSSADPGSARLYWTDKDDGQLESSNLDGSDRVTLLSGLADPRGIAIDQENNTIYWASHTTNGSIQSANCDGTNVQTFLSSLSDPADIALDLENRVLYWAEQGSNQIRRIGLDTDGPPETVLTGLNQPYYLAIRPDDGFIYWSDFNSTIIHRATIDGENPENFITGQSRVRDLEIADGFIYWGDRNSQQIRRRELAGSGSGTILFSGAADSLNRPHGLILSPDTGIMYWTDTTTDEINSAAMDGTGSVTTLVSSSLNGAWAIDLTHSTGSPYETWLTEHFTSEELANPENEATIWGENADPDLDGRANLLEFAQSTSPTIASEDPKALHGAIIESEENTFYELTFRIRKDDPSLQFQIESSDTLTATDWNTGDFTESPPRIDDPEHPQYELVTMRAPLDTRSFARLKVSR